MYRLEVEESFAAAHQLREYRGACENLHGHNWRVRLTVSGDELDRLGMLVDFGELKRLLREALLRFDHRFLNDVTPFDRMNPTSENLARHLAETIAPRLPPNARIAEVAVWESDRAAAHYRPPETE